MTEVRGYRSDLGYTVKSAMEANVGRYLKKTTGEAIYEPQPPLRLELSPKYDLFLKTKNKTISYTPDWRDGTGRYWEVKGDWERFHHQDHDILKLLMAAEQHRLLFGIVQGKDIRKSTSIPHLETLLNEFQVKIISYWDLLRESASIPFWEAGPGATRSFPMPCSPYAIYLDCVKFPEIEKDELVDLREAAENDPVAAEVLRRYRARQDFASIDFLEDTER